MRNRFAFVILPALAACAPVEPDAGQARYDLYCSGCHAADATGNGILAQALGVGAPDLTGLAAANGGDFPATYVMSKIDGYTRMSEPSAQMPAFGDLLQGPTVLVEYEDGSVTPTPRQLVEIAEYLRILQR